MRFVRPYNPSAASQQESQRWMQPLSPYRPLIVWRSLSWWIITPAPNRRLLEQEGVEFIEARGPSYLVEGLILVTGQIHRSTDFEQGFPIHYAEINGTWRPDPLIHDDQALVVHVRDKGLVVLTGCGHAGAINTLRYARVLTGIEPIYALLGGLHLTGRLFEPI